MVALAPAGIRAGMAGRPQGLGFYEQGIVVAVRQYFFYQQVITALLPFCPQPLFAAAKEGHFAFRHCFMQRFFVHKTHHQHSVCSEVLNNGRHQAVGVFFKINFHGEWSMVNGKLTSLLKYIITASIDL